MQDRKRVYLHIGQDKAGSTAIQAFLGQNHDRLNALGYDLVGGRVGNHGRVKEAVERQDMVQLAAVTEYIRSSARRRFIMSFEGFYALRDAGLAALLAPLAECHIVALFYVRRRSDKWRSGFAQNLKLQRPDQLQEARTLVNEEMHRLEPWKKQNMDYLATVRRWQEHLQALDGANEFRLRVYEKSSLADGDLLTDFGRSIDILADGQSLEAAALQRPDATLNPSLSPAAQYLTLFSKALRPTGEQSRRLARLLAACDTPGANRGSMIRDRIAKSLDRRFRRDDKVLAREFFGRSTLFREPPGMHYAWPTADNFTQLINAVARHERLFEADEN